MDKYFCTYSVITHIKLVGFVKYTNISPKHKYSGQNKCSCVSTRRRHARQTFYATQTFLVYTPRLCITLFYLVTTKAFLFATRILLYTNFPVIQCCCCSAHPFCWYRNSGSLYKFMCNRNHGFLNSAYFKLQGLQPIAKSIQQDRPIQLTGFQEDRPIQSTGFHPA